MNKKIISFLSVMIILISFVSCGNKEAEKKSRITVNGEEITKEEIDYFSSRSKADVINRYSEKYNITDFSDFWDKEFDGVTPKEELKNIAVEEAVKAKIKLCLMRDSKIYDDISFSGLENKAKEYNLQNGNSQNTVGIKTVDLEQFYTYYISNGEMQLKNILAKTTLCPTADEIKDFKSRNNANNMSEELIISYIVADKYEKYIDKLVKEAEIKTN